MNNLDKMDILEAECVLGDDNLPLLNNASNVSNNTSSVVRIDANGRTSVDRIGKRGNQSQNVIQNKIKNDPWFRKTIDENKMLERHIRFLKHIIEKEQQRCNFKEVIFGKKEKEEKEIDDDTKINEQETNDLKD